MAKSTQKISLSEHTLDINTRSYNVEEFDFAEIEEYVKELTGSREYQFKSIKDIMIYLWGGRYENVTDLAKENFKKKEALRQRFESEDHFLATLPLPDRLSGVCHMATGTGKSYVMFALAYLSIIMDKVDRVLVIGPPSTIIEQGLTEKFREYLYGETGNKLKDFLPDKYKNVVVNLLNANDPIQDQSIVIENVNAVWSADNNSIGDTLFKKGGRILVLSDEVHHAYSHLKFSEVGMQYDFDEEDVTKTSEVAEERLWMKYIREQPIKCHIGFTGTPYNQDDFFTDVIFNYSIKEAIDEKYIKNINSIIRIEDDQELTEKQRFELIIKTHLDNKRKYSYKDKEGNPRVKPISIFINNTQAAAKKNADIFAKELAEYYGKHVDEFKGLSRSELEILAHKKIITVISNTNKSEYEEQLNQIEEIDSDKVGGQVEFIFAVNKLSEGWDVDNVFQIVPSQEKVFNSKLLISQVLGRGLRIPRKVPAVAIEQDYPVVTITNHEKFGNHIKELYDQVTECELRFHSRILDETQDRAKNNFNIFNLTYVPSKKTMEKTETAKTNRTLLLEPQPKDLDIKIEYLRGTKKFSFDKEFSTVDQVTTDIARKFRYVAFEHENFDFSDDFDSDTLPTFENIKKTILESMKKAGIEGNKISTENRKKIELYFNQFLPKGTKKVIRENIEGAVVGKTTENMPMTTVNIGRLDSEVTIFISEEYREELLNDDLFILDELEKQSKKIDKNSSFEQKELFRDIKSSKYIREFVRFKNIFLVNPSMFKTPQSSVIVTHKPEREFVIDLIDHGKYIESWVKSPDSGFYSLDYEYWKGGKDRVRRSFNPDFFISIDTNKYLSQIENNEAIKKLKVLQNKGVEKIVLATEIKGEDDYNEVTVAKEEYGKDHFERLSTKLSNLNPINLEKEYRNNFRQYYIFTLLRSEDMGTWFRHLIEGTLVLNI